MERENLTYEPAAPDAAIGTDLDPITQQIVANALGSIADEMATTIFRTAHSTVVRDAMDFSASVCNPRGEQIAQAVSVPFHLGSIPTAMQSLLAQFGASMEPGDIYVMNDPFDGGMHTPDIFVIKPVFLDQDVIGFAATTAHHADVGGRLPGSAACDNTEIFQEGLRLPWTRLYARGEPVQDIWKIIAANVRIPTMTLGDISAQVAACAVAERELRTLVTRYGKESFAAVTDGLLAHTELLVRQEIASWPDGTASYVDYLDSDGIELRDVPISAEVTISGDSVTVDFSASSPMVRGALNCTRSIVQAAVYQAIRAALTTEIPNTEGAFRPIRVITKPGTITEVVMPGASSMRGVTAFRIFDTVQGALAQLLPDRIPAAGEGGNTLAIFTGETARGEPYIYYELVCGTWGATPLHDGNDGLSNPSAAAANIPVEVAEAEFPIVIERYGFVADSGGAGLHRGGLALERTWRCESETASLTVRSDRQVHPPFGLSDGRPGACSENLIIRADGKEEHLPPMCIATLSKGDVFRHRTAGGGGWGRPEGRDPHAVADDVANGKVGREAAEVDYSVGVRDDGTVDDAATSRLRARSGGTVPG